MNSFLYIGKSFLIEKNLLIPLLKGQNIRRWRLLWQELYVIYPHRKENGKLIAIQENEMKVKYPNTYKYFKNHQNNLENRSQWGKGPVEWHGVFYAIMTPSKLEYFEKTKMLSPALTDKNNFALDKEKHCFVGGTAGVLGLLPKSDNDIHYMLGLLNSKVFEFYLKHKTPVKSGGYYQYSVKHLKRLPIKSSTNQKEVANQITQNVIQILKLNEESNILNEKTKGFPNSYFEGDWTFQKLINVINRQSLSKSSYKISQKIRTTYFRDLEDKEIFRIILARNEFIDFISEEEATYVYEILKTKNRITKREILDLTIPREEYMKGLMYQYKNDKEKIEENKKTIKILEKKIDDLVYKIYDISYEGRLIIENYLTKF